MENVRKQPSLASKEEKKSPYSSSFQSFEPLNAKQFFNN
jgi:hypothetical protein